MPLGKLQKATVLEGYDVLKQISNVIGCASANTSSSSGGSTGISGGSTGISGGSSGISGGSGGLGIVGAAGRAEIERLTNAFYTVIPHVSARNVRLELIDTPAKLKAKIEMVEALGEIEIASRVIDTKHPTFDMHPIDAKYAQLNAKLRPIDTADPMHHFLDEYLQNTHAATHATYRLKLTQAFEIEREGEACSFNETVGNRQLLWHGSRLSNWCGILSQGLRIAPPEAPVTGYMFGKGVYFADASSKSANYCFANRQSPEGVLLLSEVALGSQYERLGAEYEAAASCCRAGKQSTWGKGKTAPDPSGTVPLPGSSNVSVPRGKHAPTGVNSGHLQYNEFIVYNLCQIKQRFVLQVKFCY